MSSLLVRSTTHRAVRAGDIVSCPLTVPLSNQVYRRLLANLMLGAGDPWMD